MAAKNPIHKALETADKVQAANAKLESMSRPKTLQGELAGMKHGEAKTFSRPDGAGKAQVTVHYHSRQSYGDNGSPVRGAVVGEYTVTHTCPPGQPCPSGSVSQEYGHGPFAETEAAAKRGASRDSKVWMAGTAASRVHSVLASHDVPLFRDRRG